MFSDASSSYFFDGENSYLTQCLPEKVGFGLPVCPWRQSSRSKMPYNYLSIYNVSVDICDGPLLVYSLLYSLSATLKRHVVCNVPVSHKANRDRNQLGPWRYSDPKDN